MGRDRGDRRHLVALWAGLVGSAIACPTPVSHRNVDGQFDRLLCAGVVFPVGIGQNQVISARTFQHQHRLDRVIYHLFHFQCGDRAMDPAGMDRQRIGLRRDKPDWRIVPGMAGNTGGEQKGEG